MTSQTRSSLVANSAICLLFAGLLLVTTPSVANAQEGDADRPMVVGIVPGPVAAVDMFLKIEGIDGEAKDEAHSGWIDVLSVDWGAVRATPVRATPARPQRGAERKRPGRVKYGDITLKRGYDAASPKLMLAVANGTRVPSVVLEFTTTEAEGVRYVRYELQDVIISSYRIDAGGDGDRPTESISLNFAKVKSAYIPQDRRGKLDYSWKVEEGEG
jgi:type VI secretion system Hcp family effector